MTAQAEMFPKTVPELLAAYRARLVADVESLTGRVVKAQTKLDEALDDLRVFDAAMVATQASPSDCAGQHTGPAECDDCTSDDDSCGGYVRGAHTKPCPACEGDGRPFARDGSHNGNAKCRMCAGTGRIPDDAPRPSVTVHYDGGTIEVPVGDRTRFAALIYAVAEQAGVKDVDVDEWTITSDDDGTVFSRKTIVLPSDHGRGFVVERRQP